jgi:hypothetical protein
VKLGTAALGASDGGAGGHRVPAGTTAFDDADAGPVPALFVAVTVKV